MENAIYRAVCNRTYYQLFLEAQSFPRGLELRSRKTVRLSGQIMSADKYLSIYFRAKWRLLFIYLLDKLYF